MAKLNVLIKFLLICRQIVDLLIDYKAMKHNKEIESSFNQVFIQKRLETPTLLLSLKLHLMIFYA